MAATKGELADLSDFAWQRLRARLEGLTDEEYLWEPEPGCWTVRQRAGGTRKHDWAFPAPDPAPFTTLAWRLWHLIDMYGEDRAPRFLDVRPHGRAIGLDDPDCEPPATAAAAIDMLERAHARWDAHLDAVPEERLREVIGPVGGQYAHQSRAAFVLHMLDEFIHHGAEVGLLRDLWRWQRRPQAEHALVERAIQGDLTLVADLERDPRARQAALQDHPDLLGLAASYGRWDLVTGLAGLGFPVGGPGRAPLHLAAGAGELEVVKVLLERGGDPEAQDPDFAATPAQWAEFFGHHAVTEWLADRAGPESE